MRKLSAYLTASIVLLSALLVIPSSVRATDPWPLGDNVVAKPDANASYAYYNPLSDHAFAKTENGIGSVMFEGSTQTQIVATGDYDEGGSAPPDDANISEVYIVAIVKHNTAHRHFWLSFGLNGTGSTMPPYGIAFSSIYETNSSTFQEFRWRVTNLLTHPYWGTTWTPEALKSVGFWAWIISNDNSNSYWRMTVDYIGVTYNWTAGEANPPGEGGPSYESLPLSLTGLMSMAGFIGMIALPAVGIWMWRQEGGSKIAAMIGIFIAFMVCFALFLGSLGS